MATKGMPMARFGLNLSVEDRTIVECLEVGEEPLQIGRSNESDVRLSLPWVSRYQCRVRATERGIEIEVEGPEPILKTRVGRSKRAILGPGDSFWIKRLRGDVVSLETSRARAGAAKPGKTMVGPYEIQRSLGRGSVGEAFLAKDPGGREVVVKRMLEEAAVEPVRFLRFEREVAVLGSFEHPGIVKFLDSGWADGLPYLVQEYVEGETLGRTLRRGPVEPRRAAETALQLAEALAHAHSKNVVHRDIKPSNIMIDSAGRPRLLDFGIARVVEGTRLTHTGLAIGSLAYMAPEQSEGEAGPLADVYGLGAVLYQMLTGARPFQAESRSALLRMVLRDRPRPPSTLNDRVDRGIEAICLSCLAKDPGGRPTSAAALATELRRYLEGEPEPAIRPGTGELAIEPSGDEDRGGVPTEYCPRCRALNWDAQVEACPSCGRAWLRLPPLEPCGTLERHDIRGRGYLASQAQSEEARILVGAIWPATGPTRARADYRAAFSDFLGRSPAFASIVRDLEADSGILARPAFAVRLALALDGSVFLGAIRSARRCALHELEASLLRPPLSVELPEEIDRAALASVFQGRRHPAREAVPGRRRVRVALCFAASGWLALAILFGLPFLGWGQAGSKARIEETGPTASDPAPGPDEAAFAPPDEDALRAFCESADPEEKARALARLPIDEDTLPVLLEASRLEPDRELRQRVLAALVESGDEALRDALLERFRDRSTPREIRWEAIGAAAGWTAEAARPLLLQEAVSSEDPDDRYAALVLLGRQLDQSIELQDRLLEHLASIDGDPAEALVVALVLSRSESPEFRARVERTIERMPAETREFVQQALSE